MEQASISGWHVFRRGYPWFGKENPYRIRAYSEFMPPVKTGISPFDGSIYPWSFSEDDPYGWKILEIEEEYFLKPGLEKIGPHLLEEVFKLGSGTLPVQLAGHQQRNIRDNIFWTPELAAHEGSFENEKYITFLPLSLSKTKDDKGRVCWTFFGASEQGPEKAFWKSFYESPDQEAPEAVFLNLMQWIFKRSFGITLKSTEHLQSIGFRILPANDCFPFSYWHSGTLPAWTSRFLMKDSDDLSQIRYILTFRPFGMIPQSVRDKYLEGKLSLLPFPGTMLLWGIPEYLNLQKTLYNAIQIPMLRLVKRDEGYFGLRVPQSGWVFQEGLKGTKARLLEEFIVEHYIRTSRWDKFHRNEDGLLKSNRMNPVIETLFSTSGKALDLYNKPMARNSQIFNEMFELLLDGPRAGRKAIGEAALRVMEGGNFRYRFYFPPMLAGLHEVMWHRPLVACFSKATGKPEIATDLITGYLTGYDSRNPDPASAVELWPRFSKRELQLSLLHDFNPARDHYLHQTTMNLMAILDAWDLLDRKPLEKDFARSLVRIPKNESLEEWIKEFPERAMDPAKGKKIARDIQPFLDCSDSNKDQLTPLTFGDTANRDYEVAYWNQIRFLAMGEYVNKDNADIVQDPPTIQRIGQAQRDLFRLGEYLLGRYREMIRDAGMEGSALAGELPFRWETDFEFNLYGGWQANQEGTEYERNLLVVIPGRNRKEAVVMADHYDTAYMADVFDPESGGSGSRISAAGADDNHSATSTLLLAAPIYLRLAKEGKLERDIWLLHLTGEEFPSDCMGARNFCENIIQRSLQLHTEGGAITDLSETRIKGVLVMDMIAHNRDSDRDIFQISPGKTAGSLRLAREARKACQAWNAGTLAWNETPDRKGCPKGKRTPDERIIPPKALHLAVDGEVRTWEDPHSTLYNTDGIIFSDLGIPVMLFMENYDISRSGYHDTHDTMKNIDLDYGSAVSAIAIETVARLAGLKELHS